MSIDPGLVGATVNFNPIPTNRVPTPDKLISLPFHISLPSALTADITTGISFLSPLIFSTYPSYFRMVLMNLTPQTLALKYCNPATESLQLGSCLPCSTEANIQSSTPLACNSWGDVRFFTYTVTKNFGNDDLRNFYATLILENFDINTNQIPNLGDF